MLKGGAPIWPKAGVGHDLEAADRDKVDPLVNTREAVRDLLPDC
jgi:hypothetical protein